MVSNEIEVLTLMCQGRRKICGTLSPSTVLILRCHFNLLWVLDKQEHVAYQSLSGTGGAAS